MTVRWLAGVGIGAAGLLLAIRTVGAVEPQGSYRIEEDAVPPLAPEYREAAFPAAAVAVFGVVAAAVDVYYNVAGENEAQEEGFEEGYRQGQEDAREAEASTQQAQSAAPK